MKNKISFLLLIFIGLAFSSCEKYLGGASVGGDPSPMADEGTTFSAYATNIDGVSKMEAMVTSGKAGVATLKGSALVTNTRLKSILSNIPELKVDGDEVTAEGIQFKNTSKGIESVKGLDPGIIVKYDSKVGDTYKIDGSNEVREVVSKSIDDDYPYGFMNIKVMKIEEKTNKKGVKSINYWANHKWGLVGIEFIFDDGSSAKFPILCSTNN